MKKRALAVLLAGALLAATAVPAFAADSDSSVIGDTSIEGDNGVKSPIISYQIPIRLEFAVDPFQKGAGSTNSQVFSGDFPIINKSDVAIQASIKPTIVDKTADAANHVVLMETPNEVNQNDLSVTAKQLYMEAVPAQNADTKAVSSATPTAKARPMAYNVTSDTVTVTAVGTDGTANAILDLDLAGGTFTNPTNDAFFTLTIKDAGNNRTLGSVTGAKVTAPSPTATDIAASFNSASVKLDTDKAVANFTIGQTTSALKLTSADQKELFLSATKLSYTIAAKKGAEAVVKLDTDTPPTYPAYDPADAGSESEGKSMVKPADSTAINFLLQKADYINDYTDDDEATLFKDMAANKKGVGVFRFMGTVNPSADWKAGDFTVKAVYKVSGVSGSAYDAVGNTSGGFCTNAQNVKAPASIAPSVTATVTYSGSGALEIPYSLGEGKAAAKTVTKVMLTVNGGVPSEITDFNLDTAGKVIIPTSSVGFIFMETGSGNVFTITFDDKVPTTVTCTVTKP